MDVWEASVRDDTIQRKGVLSISFLDSWLSKALVSLKIDCLDHSLMWYPKVICASTDNSTYKIFISVFFLKVISDLECEW